MASFTGGRTNGEIPIPDSNPTFDRTPLLFMHRFGQTKSPRPPSQRLNELSPSFLLRESASPMEASIGEAPWAPLITEADSGAKNAASPFAWWRSSLHGQPALYTQSSSVSKLIQDMESAFKEAIKQ